jgi:glycosyltransferase involved in cell wall biosynthesis
LRVVVVGSDGVGYGDAPPYGGTYREMLLTELGAGLDRARVHFLGQVARATYLEVLQVSTVHVYFTYPFVLSWSLLEALAAGCVVLGSANAPVDEVLRDGENGLLVDPADAAGVAARIESVLEHPDRMQALRERARATAVDRYDLRTRMLPRWLDLVEGLARGLPPAPALFDTHGDSA